MITKIELQEPEKMAIGEVKDELIMRLHDAFLLFREDQYHVSAKAFGDAESGVKDGDFSESLKALKPWLDDLGKSQSENASRIQDLFDRLVSWKKQPASLALATVEQFELIETEVVDEFGMSQSEYLHLSLLEEDIKKGLDLVDQGRTLVGDSLKEIRDKKLYRAYGTFEAYCEQNRGFSRSRAYQFIDEASVVNNLLTAGINPEALPENEAQARALAPLTPERQVEVWSEVKASGKPSAAKIKAIASGGSALTPSPSPSGGEGGKSSPEMIDVSISYKTHGVLSMNPVPDGFIEFNGYVIPVGEAKATQKALNKALAALDQAQDDDGDWDKNLWETPDNIARAIANLLRGGQSICEPCAGSGQIAKAIASLFEEKGWEYELTAIEILKERAAKLEDNRYFSIDANFLEFDFGSDTFDVVVTNPPFDRGLEILEKSLSLLNISGRCLFLLPIAYFQTQERAKQFAGMGAYIHRIYPIVGRVAYLKNGIPESGRQCEDAIFDIRRGKSLNGVEFIWQ
jgi:hypothetical protein